jgi:pimeloyl-ACP methyl ester carboxylesterase
MFNEREFIARVEAADPQEFARIMERPTREEETALRTHFGAARFERMRELAETAQATRTAKRGNVVVLHGIMGGELTVYGMAGGGSRIWVHLLRLAGGGFAQLRLDASGNGPADPRRDARATGIYKREYGEQLLRLSAEWNVQAFWYDWRRDLHEAASQLHQRMDAWFGPGAPVHLVAHSMGGLVARTFIANHAARWETMWDREGNGRRGGRLLMLGTPNHGSFAVPQILTGLEGMLRKLAAADLRHSTAEIRAIAGTFVGCYQMLPSPLVMPEIEPLYQADTWGALGIPQNHLNTGRAFHVRLRDVIDPKRMIYVAGYDRVTFNGIRGLQVADRNAYTSTYDGDGRVTHRLGLLQDVPTYYVRETHGSLPGNRAVLRATTELLETGRTAALKDALTRSRALGDADAAARAQAAQEEREIAEIRQRAERLERLRGAEDDAPMSDDERVIAELLLEGWLGRGAEEPAEPVAEAGGLGAMLDAIGGVDAIGTARPDPLADRAPRRIVKVRIRVVHGRIEDSLPDTDPPVDALAVGHYVNVRPQNAELALDRAISRALLGLGPDDPVPEGRLLLTELTERGTLRGELGQPFILPDPRTDGDESQRIIVVEGMGVPGRFGAPELTVLVRELIWVLGRLGRRHVATVLIGSGVGAVRTRDAVAAWMHGLQQALAGAAGEGGRVESLTFVELDAEKVVDIDEALQTQDAWYERQADAVTQDWLDIEYEPLAPASRDQLLELAADRAAEAARRRVLNRDRGSRNDEPTRVIVSLEREADQSVYRVGAITQSAAVPEREVPISTRLVENLNNELPALRTAELQASRGRLLEQLLLRDVREAMATQAPLVMVLDSTTARIHWEMLAQPGAGGGNGPALEDGFLATCRGFTRQLRTAFAPIPDAPPPAQRPLRVLIVADPASDAPLHGAMREGREIDELYRSFNTLRSTSARTVETRLLNGPHEATAEAVLDAILTQHFDVLHFAGHCKFDETDPARSGWIFSDGMRLSAHELRRVDRIPKFVFSNACESGITPDRSDRRTAALAPSFAEAFFERGVANFVCTAWPVGDDAARTFALHLYAALLGLGAAGDPLGGGVRDPEPMHVAMYEARMALRSQARDTGARQYLTTWGAYQHYGSPTFRFFYPHEVRR